MLRMISKQTLDQCRGIAKIHLPQPPHRRVLLLLLRNVVGIFDTGTSLCRATTTTTCTFSPCTCCLRFSSTTTTTTTPTTSKSDAAAAADTAAPPSVNDIIIQLTIVDSEGARRKVPAVIGRTLYETFIMHEIDIGPSSRGSPSEVKRTDTWIEPTFGEGPTSGYDHVVLMGDGRHSAARITEYEQQQLEDYWDFTELYEGSRLASMIVLTKEMDGMVVYVPDRLVDDLN